MDVDDKKLIFKIMYDIIFCLPNFYKHFVHIFYFFMSVRIEFLIFFNVKN